MKRKGLLLLHLFYAGLLIALFYFQIVPTGRAENYGAYLNPKEEGVWITVCEGHSPIRSKGVLSVNYYRSSGPEDVEILVQYRSPGSKDYNLSTQFSLSLDQGGTISIPTSTAYCIQARALAGTPGSVSFQIALS